MAQSLKRKPSALYYCYYCVLLPRKKSLSLSRDLQFIVQYSRARPLQPSSQKNWMRNKKSYFCDYKKRAELYNNWIACKYIWQKKSSKFWKWPSWLSYLLKKQAGESEINSNFLTQQVTLSVEKKLFFLYIHTCLFYSIRVLKSKNDMNLHFNWILFSFSRSILSSKPYVEFLIFV